MDWMLVLEIGIPAVVAYLIVKLADINDGWG